MESERKRRFRRFCSVGCFCFAFGDASIARKTQSIDRLKRPSLTSLLFGNAFSFATTTTLVNTICADRPWLFFSLASTLRHCHSRCGGTSEDEEVALESLARAGENGIRSTAQKPWISTKNNENQKIVVYRLLLIFWLVTCSTECIVLKI